MNDLRIIDLFSGAGGLTVGFTRLSNRPFKPVWANDNNIHAVNTYNRNFGNHCHYGDIVDILMDSNAQIPIADVVVGGPPCQGFSLLNKRRANDPRKKLWIPFMKIVSIANVKAFVMENVPQLLGSLEYEEIADIAKDMGFNIWAGTLFACDYGVPQQRKRAFIIGAKGINPAKWFPPPRSHYPPNNVPSQLEVEMGLYTSGAMPWRTVRHAIANLPDPVGTEIKDISPPLDIHFGRNPTAKSVARYRAIPKEGMNRFDLERVAPELTPECWKRKRKGGTDLFGRLWWERPSFTSRTEFFKHEKGRYLHPEKHRPITHREAARLQSFPDDFIFTGTKIEIAKQIGNAVPPLLSSKIADRLYEMLQSSVESDDDGHIPGGKAPRNNVARKKQEHARRKDSTIATSSPWF